MSIQQTEDQKKCAHPACRCTVADDERYCSQRCQDAGGEIEISCDCAHPGCSLAD
jgi:metallothionein